MKLTQTRLTKLIEDFAPTINGSIYEEQTNDFEPDNWQGFLRGTIEDLETTLECLRGLQDALNQF